MNPLMAQAIAFGVLLAAWDFACGLLGLWIWPAIIAWGCFYASGRKTDGLVKTIVALLSGAFWARVAILLAGALGGAKPVNVLIMGLAGVAIVLQSRVSLLSFIGGTAVGAGAFLSISNLSTENVLKFCVSMIAGALLGYLSELLAGKLGKS